MGDADSRTGLVQSPLTLHLDVAGSHAVVTLDGELDVATSGQLADVLGDLVEQGFATVDVDCAHLSFIDSSGMRTLVEFTASRGFPRGSVVLVNPSPLVRRTIEITGLHTYLRMVDEPRAI